MTERAVLCDIFCLLFLKILLLAWEIGGPEGGLYCNLQVGIGVVCTTCKKSGQK